MAVILYNLLMLVVDIVIPWSVRNSEPGKQLSTARRALIQGTLISLLLTVTLASGFGKLKLLAFGIFLHGNLQLLTLSWLWFSSKRRLSRLCLALALSLAAIAVDAFLIEPHWLEVTTYEIPTSKLKQPIRVAVLADLQTDNIGEYEDRVITQLMAGRPDLILLPGDFLQEHDSVRRKQLRLQLAELLQVKKFSAPLGIIAVGGNTDSPDWPSIFDGLPVTIADSTLSIDLEQLHVTALSLHDSFSQFLKIPSQEKFHIVFGHGPDFALGEVNADLLIAGHTHGGQVRIPGLGPVITFSKIPRTWAAGLTELTPERHLIVSRGIGMERADAPRLRFLCRPQLVFVDLVPANRIDEGEE